MSYRQKVITKTVTEQVGILICDICQTDIGDHIDVWPHSTNATTGLWWKEPIDSIVNIFKGHIKSGDPQTSDFNVHVQCAYDAIREKVALVQAKSAGSE